MLKKLIITLTALSICMMFSLSDIVDASPNKEDDDRKIEREHKRQHHRLIEKDKLEELTRAGYSKKDIFMGAILGKKANKSIDEVLALFEKNKSWEDTAEQLGIDMEEFEKYESMHEWKELMEDNSEAVIEHLATYSNKKAEDIKLYMKDGISLRFLVGAAAMAKLSNKELNDIIAYKKEGKPYHEIMKDLNIDNEALHKELEQFKDDIEKKIGEDAEDKEE